MEPGSGGSGSAMEPREAPVAQEVRREGGPVFTRRRFLGLAAGLGAAGGGVFSSACGQTRKEESSGGGRRNENERPLVARHVRPGTAGAGLTLEAARARMDRLLAALGDGKDPAATLRRLFRKGERIGIKLNCLAGRGLSPTPALVEALVRGFLEAGWSPDRIVVFERAERELRRAGFPVRREDGVRYLGTDSPGMGYEPMPFCFKTIGSCFTRILTREVEGLVNFGVLKDHDLAGISVGLKNLFGLIHNPNKYHDDNCSPFVAHLAAAPPVREKLRLTLCDGLTAQYKGGPSFKPAYTWKAGILLASTDPVALDAVGAAIIDEKRKAKGAPSLADSGQEPRYLPEARRLGLGEDRLDKIEILDL